jgi:DNA-binding transcriptional MerR regulator
MTLLPSSDEIGYRGATACTAAGISYRQLDYWARTGLVEPTVRSAAGSGSQRLYGFRDILEDRQTPTRRGRLSPKH